MEYVENEVIKTREELIQESNKDIEMYLNNDILPNTINGSLVDKKIVYTDTEEGVTVKTIYIINEDIGEFKERNVEVTNEQYTNWSR